jgi:hypothetical protein
MAASYTYQFVHVNLEGWMARVGAEIIEADSHPVMLRMSVRNA